MNTDDSSEPSSKITAATIPRPCRNRCPTESAGPIVHLHAIEHGRFPETSCTCSSQQNLGAGMDVPDLQSHCGLCAGRPIACGRQRIERTSWPVGNRGEVY